MTVLRNARGVYGLVLRGGGGGGVLLDTMQP